MSSGLTRAELQLHLHLAVVCVGWLVLGRDETLHQVGRQVDPVQPGLGYESAPVESELTVIGVQVAKTVRIVQIFHDSG